MAQSAASFSPEAIAAQNAQSANTATLLGLSQFCGQQAGPSALPYGVYTLSPANNLTCYQMGPYTKCSKW